MESFGCCSSYLECSKAKKCIHDGDPLYTGCVYRANMAAGRIFYGAGETTKTPEAKESRTDSSIFLYCFNRLFAIYSRRKDLYSMDLTPEQFEKIELAFTEAHIPYRLEIEDISECIIDHPTESDPAPANSRVVFMVEGEDFHLLNYNSWLIKQAIAEKIAKALDNKYITASVELRGKYAKVSKVEPVTYETKPVNRPVEPEKIQKEIKAPEIQPEKKAEENPAYIQASIFNIVQDQLINEIPEVRIEKQKIIKLPVQPIAKADTALIPKERLVIAEDEYWGTYRGEIVGFYYKALSKEIMIKVRIIETIKYPRQDAIFNKDAVFNREPYPVNSVQNFEYCNIRIEEEFHESLSLTG
jgi:hypothetical protein